MKTPSRFPFRDFEVPGVLRMMACGLLLGAGFGLASCKPAPEKTAAASAPVAARVGDAVILVSEVEQEIAARVQRGAPVPPRETLLEDMVERRLLVQRALAAGLDKAPDVQRSWENLLISRYKEEHLRRDAREATVTEEEISQRYEASPDRFRHAGKARLAILMMALPPSLEADQREKKLADMREAQALAAQPTQEPGFGPLAARYSEDDVTRHRGGDTGWLNEGVDYRWPAPVIRAGFALPAGGVSDPLEADGAVFLVKKLDERPSTKVALEQVRGQLRREIHTEKLRAVEASFARRSREGVVIQTYPEALAGLRIPVPSAKTSADGEPPPGIP